MALDVSRQNPPGSLILCHPGNRLLEVVRNLGLHRLMQVDCGDFPMDFGDSAEKLEDSDQSKSERTKMILSAHEKLLELDEGGRARFQDVVSYLKHHLE